MSYTTETKPHPNLDIQTFQRKTFDVEGVQVTEENFEDIAAWCGGSIVTVTNTENSMPLELKDRRYIQVDVSRPQTPRQTQAYVGDWVLYAAKGFKVYGTRPFQRNFEPKKIVPEVKKTDDTPQELMATSEPAYIQDNSTVPPTIRPANHQDTEPEPIVHDAGVSGPDTVAGGNWGGHE